MTLEEIVDTLKALPDEDRGNVLRCFCKDCHVFLGDDMDWSGTNYCSHCSPDPIE